MGVVAQVGSERTHALRPATVIGRARRADLRLDDDVVSALHAAVQWTKGRWHLKDLGSHNGTTLAGRRLVAGELSLWPEGAVASFGSERVSWRLADGAPPAPMARDGDGNSVTGEHGMLVLSVGRGPSSTVFRTTLGGWKLETEDGIVAASDGDTVEIGGTAWTLDLPEAAAPTRSNAASLPWVVSQARLRFSSSSRPALTVERGAATLSVGQGPHIDLLLLLARARASAERDGWVARQTVTEALGMSANHVSVAIHRARKRLAELGVEDAMDVVQRRRGELRLGCADVVLPP
ncbi:MAG: FHA domain-containing protein [Myxococcota bacterium]